VNILLPELSLVLLIGASGSGKSTFARQHFQSWEVVSSDFCRGLVSNDPNSLEATDDAFAAVHFLAARRLARGLLTVIDATNLRAEDRRPLVDLAREHHVLPVAIVLDVPRRVCEDRNAARPDRNFGPHVIRNHITALKRGLYTLRREGFRHVLHLDSPEAIERATVTRQPLWNNRKHDTGPFDLVGDVHGCYEELKDLLGLLGYEERRAGDVPTPPPDPALPPDRSRPLPAPDPDWPCFVHPRGRRVVFLGDLVDRGPATPAVLKLAMAMAYSGQALCVPGNHDIKLLRKLGGANVRLTHGLAETMEQLAKEPPEFAARAGEFLDALVSHYVLDGGRLVVAHAGLKESMQGRGSGAVREFCLFGETTGETDEFGLPVRYNWAAEYRGRAAVVYGHTPVPEPQWLNNTINIDAGCAFGGRLTALRYPERQLMSVPARAQYAVPRRPFLEPGEGAPALSMQQGLDDVLDLSDVAGKRVVSTPLVHCITIREENAAAALEVMSRFAIDPHWLIYLPPTMAPTETSRRPGLLEHPAEGFADFRHRGVDRVVCEQKHMGSRAVVVVCKDTGAARRRFGVSDERRGVIYTRTGRRFFDDEATEASLLGIVAAAAARAGLWEELSTEWLCLDCELMPWSAKAQGLIQGQYAPVGAAARASLGETVAALERAGGLVAAAAPLLEQFRARAEAVNLYAAAYRRYCWPVNSISDYKLAPFHLLASEGKVHTDRDHVWHLETLARLAAAADSVLMATPFCVVSLTDPESEAGATRWWEELTAAGNEGMVVKPLDFIARTRTGLVQPAVKCRGREYLRIIYGPEYTLLQHLERLRSRGLGHKRSLALREFALGIEALDRFVRREPLRRVHECVFGVLALESEPVDPRL
jgi:protein phosphatase